MRTKLHSLYSSFVRDGDDLKLFVAACVLMAAALCVLVYDVATVVLGTVEPNVHMPFVLAAGLAGIAGCILAVLRHGVKNPDRDGGRGPGPDSYQHPSRWPAAASIHRTVPRTEPVPTSRTLVPGSSIFKRSRAGHSASLRDYLRAGKRPKKSDLTRI